ncbi:putative membrane protein YdjX (TVP38/TMEM64 family) [Brevundimonas alba]|uniref:TVP38/TMEM64 family membrane protein n=1 Tax=Brevundimonas alba TaxID=74314 RepID=A0A7X5YNM8_9CAUL|nr:VTT domain-containing protein [Brevundimonas alba]NJC42541.1 putative membrane protein YdjX (TVP38/TMEM64 family) [Brevundimonas alba]
MRRLLDFVLNMEGRRWRAALATALLLGATVALLMVGKSQFGLAAEEKLEAWLQGYAGSPWAFAATVVLFIVAAFIGAPQFILIAACVVAFGPWFGFLYSWAATVVSAGVTYWLGRGPTARLLDRFGGRTLTRLKGFVGKNAFYASFMIRNVPSAPFIVVNMAFGATRASFTAYLLGCALGVLPKTALVAFFGGAVVSAVSGDGVWTSLILAGVAVVWLGLMLGVRELVKRRERAAGLPD